MEDMTINDFFHATIEIGLAGEGVHFVYISLDDNIYSFVKDVSSRLISFFISGLNMILVANPIRNSDNSIQLMGEMITLNLAIIHI